MSNGIQYPRCPHKLNPASCLKCYHARSRQQPGAPRQQVSDGRPKFDGPPAPPHIQRAIDRQRGIEHERQVREPERGAQEHVPVKRVPNVQKHSQQVGQLDAPAKPLEPARTTAHDPWPEDPKTGIALPPKRPSLIDSVPQHPNLAQTTRH